MKLLFGKEKKVEEVKAGTPIDAMDKEKIASLPHAAQKEEVKEAKEVKEPRKFTEQDIELYNDWEKYKQKNSGILSMEDLAVLPPGSKDALMFNLMFAIWRELHEINDFFRESSEEEEKK